MTRQQARGKARITITIDPAILRTLDCAVRAHGFPSRSRALEAALSHWLSQQKREQIEREVEAYYRSFTAQEKREDREWAEFASRQIGRRKD
jgi:metal-responsive CopG/Arc/MetJ family transcriptional regulator